MTLSRSSPELEILAIIVSFGNTDVDSSYLNIFKIYQALERHLESFPEERERYPNFDPNRKPVLARGTDLPLEGALHSAQYFHGRDGLGNIQGRHPELNVVAPDASGVHPYLNLSAKPGSEVVLDILQARSSRSVSYVALGPLTNLALALRTNATIVRERIGRVITMGGALDVPGNTSPVAEFNFFADPFAVKELLMPADNAKGFPLERFVLLPLDITTPHEMRFADYIEKVDPAFRNTGTPSIPGGKPPLTHFTSSWLERAREVMLEFGKDAIELHDPVAVWCAIENPPVENETVGGIPQLQEGWRATERKFEVERFGEITRGMLVVDRREDAGAYAPGVNRAQAQAELEHSQTINPDNFESLAVPAEVEVEADSAKQDHGRGVACVVQTPGFDTAANLLFQRVWGIRRE
ncbi:nucleoside hydrolase [Punctularia strigosozonata HHB-11173 SS5]|uniref:nucleoside hydrolase n=1 Tax=Punctularia strigosozonata (strain HHB-11173) TaxID=741275 RepID=UPI0004418610|nr:nucleoside hydrolase [Punctularia strigosozonata HHB-11173 SS5]EIN11701.1 nucleoside hydrolase [Punctularia strigosozonata HHB-11173 SS5]